MASSASAPATAAPAPAPAPAMVAAANAPPPVCSGCRSSSAEMFRRYFSTRNDSYYFFSELTNTSFWALPKCFQLNFLCSECAKCVCEASWKKCKSATTGQFYFFNFATTQTRTTLPETMYPKERQDLLRAGIVDGLEGTPAHLASKRDYFFRGVVKLFNVDSARVQEFRIDQVASFSVSESNVAHAISQLMLKHLNGDRSLVVCDGMACVGGNTISFSYHFDRVLSNEFDYGRYHMLIHNVRVVLGRRNVRYFNQSITDLICMYRGDEEETAGERERGNPSVLPHCDVLFLDPEWGGVDYKSKGAKLQLMIGPVGVDEFVERAMENNPRLQHICLKLPLNFDNASLEATARRCDCSYTLYTPDNSELRKMSLTVITRVPQGQGGAAKRRRFNGPLESDGGGGSSGGGPSGSA